MDSAARPQVRIHNVNIRTIRDILSFFKSVFVSFIGHKNTLERVGIVYERKHEHRTVGMC